MIKEILLGAMQGVRVMSFFYAALVCLAYASKRLSEKRTSWFQAVLLIIPLLFLAGEYQRVEVLRIATRSYTVSFIAAALVSAVFVIRAALDLYERSKK